MASGGEKMTASTPAIIARLVNTQSRMIMRSRQDVPRWRTAVGAARWLERRIQSSTCTCKLLPRSSCIGVHKLPSGNFEGEVRSQ